MTESRVYEHTHQTALARVGGFKVGAFLRRCGAWLGAAALCLLGLALTYPYLVSLYHIEVDIAVLRTREHPLTARDRVRLMIALGDALNVSRVNLVILPEADPFLAANVVRGERLYAQDTYLADEYDLYILRRAGDLAPQERERIALILGQELPEPEPRTWGGRRE
jgi:hypothetical protein